METENEGEGETRRDNPGTTVIVAVTPRSKAPKARTLTGGLNAPIENPAQ